MKCTDFILDLIYPERCPFCGCFITGGSVCCEDCFTEILWADENICSDCGKPVTSGCFCGKKEIPYDMCIAAAYYRDEAKKGIFSLKYLNSASAAEIFGTVIRERLDILGLTDKIDAAVPVPMSRTSLAQRGYNQAELIARAVIKGTDIPLMTNALTRSSTRHSQHSLGAADRENAAMQQYHAAKNISLEGKTILLADDVITTGATLDRCTYILKNELGADTVICAAAATT